MKTKLLIATVLILSVFISCNKKGESSQFALADGELKELKIDETKSKEDGQQIPVDKFSPPSTDTGYSLSQSPVKTNPDWDKKIIKTADLTLEIRDFKKYNLHVQQAVKQYGGYIAQEEQNLSDEKLETTINIKVPVAQFDAMINGLPVTDSKLLERKITSDDVTGQVVDTKARLEAKKQMRQKYLEFLNRSKNMEEVLQVQREINDIQEQIESAASRVAFLSHQSAYSTINLSFYQPLDGFTSTGGSPGFLSRISNAFKNGISWVGELIVGLVSIWPLLLLVAGFYFGWKVFRKTKTLTASVLTTESNQAI